MIASTSGSLASSLSGVERARKSLTTKFPSSPRSRRIRFDYRLPSGRDRPRGPERGVVARSHPGPSAACRLLQGIRLRRRSGRGRSPRDRPPRPRSRSSQRPSGSVGSGSADGTSPRSILSTSCCTSKPTRRSPSGDSSAACQPQYSSARKPRAHARTPAPTTPVMRRPDRRRRVAQPRRAGWTWSRRARCYPWQDEHSARSRGCVPSESAARCSRAGGTARSASEQHSSCGVLADAYGRLATRRPGSLRRLTSRSDPWSWRLQLPARRRSPQARPRE